jgi:hypothetical protein
MSGCCVGRPGLRWIGSTTPKPGPEVALHTLPGLGTGGDHQAGPGLGQVDLSHRKLAHRGSGLDLVHVSESTVLRVFTDAGLHLPGRPARERRERRPFPDWAELVPGVIWIYDFTHMPMSGCRKHPAAVPFHGQGLLLWPDPRRYVRICAGLRNIAVGLGWEGTYHHRSRLRDRYTYRCTVRRRLGCRRSAGGLVGKVRDIGFPFRASQATAGSLAGDGRDAFT